MNITFNSHTSASMIQSVLRLIYSKSLRIAFWTALVAGFIIHFFMLANFMVNHDSAVLPYNNLDWLLVQGKWFVTPLASLEGPYVLHYFSLAIGLFAAALCAGVLCEMFSVQTVWCARLVGIVVIAFPSVSTMMLYISLDYFAMAALLAILGAYFMMQAGARNCLVGIGLLTLSLGAYQAFLGFALAILVIDCAIRLVKYEQIRDVMRRGIGYIALVLVSILIYYLILQYRLAVTGTELSAYKGINNMASNLQPHVLVSSVITAYSNVLEFYLKDCLGLHGAHWYFPGMLLICLIAGTYGFAFKQGHLRRSSLHLLLGWMLIIFALPLSVNIIGVLAANTSFYFISIYSFVMIPLAPLLILESTSQTEKIGRIEKNSIFSVLTRATSCLILLLCFLWAMQDNTAYQKVMQINQQLTVKAAILTSQIQSHSEYINDMPVVLVGEAPYLFLKSQGISRDFESLNTGSMGLGNAAGETYAIGVLDSYLKNVMGINLNIEDSSSILHQHYGTVSAMPVYPDANSIKCLDGRIVIRMSELLSSGNDS